MSMIGNYQADLRFAALLIAKDLKGSDVSMRILCRRAEEIYDYLVDGKVPER